MYDINQELAKESLSQLSSSLTALQSQATAAIAQSRGISRTLQQEMDAARAALAEKDLLITKVKEAS